MPRRDSEEDMVAPSPPGFTTQTKPIRKDGGGHADLDAEGTEDESDADAEEEFDESTGKKSATLLVTIRTDLSRSGSLDHMLF